MDRNVIDIKILAKDLASGTINNVKKSIGGFASNVVAAGAEYANFVRRIVMLSGTAGVAIAGLGIRTAAQLETAKQGFIGLGFSVEETNDIIERIKKEAAATPFEIGGLTNATQLLSSVTKDGDRAIDFLLNVGKALAGVGKGQAELDRIIVNLQQIGATGRATTLDIKQFAFAGIPIFDMLKEETKLTGEALDDFITEGGVTFEMLEQMFTNAGTGAGRFANAFTAQAGTFNQLMSNMKDSINIFLADFVTSTGIFDLAKEAVTAFTTAVDNNRDRLIKWGVDGVSYIKGILQGLFYIIGRGGDDIAEARKMFHGLIPDQLISALMIITDRFKDLMSTLGINKEIIKEAIPVFLGLTAAITALSVIIGIITNPVVLFAAGLALLSIAIVGLKDEFGIAYNYLSTIVYPFLVDLFINAWNNLKIALTDTWTVIQTQLIPQLQQLWENLQPTLEVVSALAFVAFVGFVEIAGIASRIVLPILGVVLASIVKYLSDMAGGLKYFGDLVSSVLKGDVSGAWSAFKGLIATSLDLATAFYQMLVKIVSKSAEVAGIKDKIPDVTPWDGATPDITPWSGLTPFATGGSIKVGGNPGVDNNVLAVNGQPIARISRGEQLDITPQGGGKGGENVTINNYFGSQNNAETIINRMFFQYKAI